MRGRFRRYSQRLQSRYGREHSLWKTSTAEPNRQPGNPIRSEAELLAASRCNKIAEPGLTQVRPGFFFMPSSWEKNCRTRPTAAGLRYYCRVAQNFLGKAGFQCGTERARCGRVVGKRDAWDKAAFHA